MRDLIRRYRVLFKLYLHIVRKRYHQYVKKCLTSGFIAKPSLSLQYFARYGAKVWTFVQVGRVKVIGRENLKTPGRVIFVINHLSMLDAIVLYGVLKRFPRWMTSYHEMKGLWGLKAIIMAKFGCFAVDKEHGKTVLRPAINLIASGECMAIFPEGKINHLESGEMQPCKAGFALIGNGAFDQLGKREPIAHLPIHLNYPCRDIDSADGPYTKMGFKWRGGVIVTVGKPIYIHRLPSRVPDDVVSVVVGMIKMMGHMDDATQKIAADSFGKNNKPNDDGHEPPTLPAAA